MESSEAVVSEFSVSLEPVSCLFGITTQHRIDFSSQTKVKVPKIHAHWVPRMRTQHMQASSANRIVVSAYSRRTRSAKISEKEWEQTNYNYPNVTKKNHNMDRTNKKAPLLSSLRDRLRTKITIMRQNYKISGSFTHPCPRIHSVVHSFIDRGLFTIDDSRQQTTSVSAQSMCKPTQSHDLNLTESRLPMDTSHT